MHWILGRVFPANDNAGSAIFLAPLLALVALYLMALFLDLATAISKADGLDQSLSLAAAAASTQVSSRQFYQNGVVRLDPVSSQQVAVRQLETTLPKGAALAGTPYVVISSGAVCVRASEMIKMPFTLFPGINPQITYSSSSSAVAEGSGTSTAPDC